MKVENNLVLNKYFLYLFGFTEIKDLFDYLREIDEGIDEYGKSYFINSLISLKNLKIDTEDLLRYDQNIQKYLKKINEKRDPINLKYFQYLAILFTEIFLDHLKNKKQKFLYSLNIFLKNYQEKEDKKIFDQFTENDLRKLAFWMATGSGKTLIMHINYYQFFQYQLFQPENIILLTPNESLSKQHYEELNKSNISAKLYVDGIGTELSLTDNGILIIEMTKLVEEKKGGGVTISVNAFEGNNLIFVDEGHKGKKSEEQKWAKLRRKLAEKGFVFEYSATFGQILTEKNDELLNEYGKSIIFDYSYKYFYLDGYGKDFYIAILKDQKFTQEDFEETFFVANLLSFYEQLLVFDKHKNLAQDYQIEKPLWIFVGTTVSKTKSSNKEKGIETDIIKVVNLFKKTIEDEEWLIEKKNQILNKKYKDEKGEDLFKNKFQYLRKIDFDINHLYKTLFYGKGKLEIYKISNTDGELGLKIGENDYFGVINIGDINSFKKILEGHEFIVKDDSISTSLFDDIKKKESKINILIGSKKFIEGWDTWRISSMGLINIGKDTGSQIIQLFGRGVRLKGKNMSLKRSGENDFIKILETLNIFGIKADYLNKFLLAIKQENVEFEIIEIPIRPNFKEETGDLFILERKAEEFKEKKIIYLQIDNTIRKVFDYSQKILAIEGEMIKMKENTSAEEKKLRSEYLNFSETVLNLVDWSKVYRQINEYREQKGYWNLVYDERILKTIVRSYEIVAYSDEIFQIKNLEDLDRIEEMIVLILKNYIDSYYRRQESLFEKNHFYYKKIGEYSNLPLFSDKKLLYQLSINKDKKELIEKIKKIVSNLDKLIKETDEYLPRIYFDRSLFLPLLLKNEKIDKITPEGLVKSEFLFLQALKDYLEKNKNKLSYEIFLIRNLPFSGIGFQLKWSKFYPDFILWLKREDKQILVFVDPKGLIYSKGINDEKIVFATRDLCEIEKKLNNKNIILESFILSETPYEELIKGEDKIIEKNEYIKNHVLFLDDKDWPKIFFDYIDYRLEKKLHKELN